MTTIALLIIDVQNAILAGKGGPDRQPLLDRALDEVIGRLVSLQQRARAAGASVVLVQHDGGEGERLATGSQGWQLRPELAGNSLDPIVHKRSCDAFYQTGLDELLRRQGITHLVIGGCMTQFCVDTTTRRAVTLGYDVSLISDGHTTADAGGLTFSQIVDHHNATLDGFDAGERRVSVRPAADINFTDAEAANSLLAGQAKAMPAQPFHRARK